MVLPLPQFVLGMVFDVFKVAQHNSGLRLQVKELGEARSVPCKDGRTTAGRGADPRQGVGFMLLSIHSGYSGLEDEAEAMATPTIATAWR